MGRCAERRKRKELRAIKAWDRERDAETDAFFKSLAWSDGDVAVPKAEVVAANKWELGEVPSVTDEAAGAAWRAAQLGKVGDVAGLFKVHWKTVEQWRRKDKLPCLRHRGVIRYDLSDVLRWASARKEGV